MDGGGQVGLQMDGEQVGPRLGEGLHIPPRLLHHQMGIQKEVGVLPDGGHHRHPDGDVGHEHAVHHVHMEPVGGGGDPADLPVQVAKIGGENGRRDLYHNSSLPVEK